VPRVEDEVLAGVGALVLCDDLGAAGDHDLVDVAAHQHRAVAVGGRHRVVVAVVAHQGQRGDPPRPAVAGLVRYGRAHLQGGEVAHQPLADALGMAADPVIEPLEAALLEMRVELGEAGDARDRHQEVTARVADQALDLAFVVALAGPAEAVEEQVVRLQLGEGAGPLTLAITEDAGHRQLGVVVEDRLGHAAQKGERRVVAVEESLDPLGRVGLDEAPIRVRQVKAEEVDLLPDAPDHRHRLAKVNLRMAGRVGERDEYLAPPLPPLADVVLHRRVAAGKAVLGAQAFVDPLGGVPLLRR
jgi:hypothetical protein